MLDLDRLNRSSIENLMRLLRFVDPNARIPRRRRDEYVTFYRLRLALTTADRLRRLPQASATR